MDVLEAIAAASNGERVTVARAKEMIAAAKPMAEPVSDPYAKKHFHVACR